MHIRQFTKVQQTIPILNQPRPQETPLTQGTEPYDPAQKTDELLDKHLKKGEFKPFELKKKHTVPNQNRTDYIEKGSIELNTRMNQTVSADSQAQESGFLTSSDQ